MQAAAGDAFTESGLQAAVSFGGNGQAHVDGIVGSEIVVEIESRVAKQVRGAVLDLILHIYPKKAASSHSRPHARRGDDRRTVSVHPRQVS